jgi:hypothetical protein
MVPRLSLRLLPKAGLLTNGGRPSRTWPRTRRAPSYSSFPEKDVWFAGVLDRFPENHWNTLVAFESFERVRLVRKQSSQMYMAYFPDSFMYTYAQCGGAHRREVFEGRAITSGVMAYPRCSFEGPLNVKIREADRCDIKAGISETQ